MGTDLEVLDVPQVPRNLRSRGRWRHQQFAHRARQQRAGAGCHLCLRSGPGNLGSAQRENFPWGLIFQKASTGPEAKFLAVRIARTGRHEWNPKVSPTKDILPYPALHQGQRQLPANASSLVSHWRS